MNKLFSLVLILFSAFILFAAVPRPVLALDCTPPLTAKEAVKCGSCDAAGQANCAAGESTKSLNATIHSVINILSVIVGVAAVIMIIVAGFRFITSSGDANVISGAKKTLLYAVVGLVIVALAQLIARFVLTSVT